MPALRKFILASTLIASPCVAVEPARQTPTNNHIYVSAGDSVVQVAERDLEGTNLVTWLLAIAGIAVTLYTAQQSYKYATRPVLSFLIPGNQKGFRLNPELHNLTNTDAEAWITFKLIFEEKVYDCEEGRSRMAYGGNEIWYVPAKARITGCINLTDRIETITGSNKPPTAHTLFLESSSRYRRWNDSRGLIGRFVWCLLFRTVYRSPIQQWEFYPDQDKWVLVPNFESPREPH